MFILNLVFIFVENKDLPGVVGDLGHFLALNQVNIDSFELSRNKKGGHAMAIIRIDSDLDKEQVQMMKKIRNVISVKTAIL